MTKREPAAVANRSFAMPDEVAAVAILLISATALGNWFPEGSLPVQLFRLLWLVMYVGAVARLMQRFGRQWLTWIVRHQPALPLLLAIAVASSLWSLAPSLTLHRAASQIGTTVLGVYIGYACAPQQLMRALQWTFVLLLVASIAAVFLLPAPSLAIGPGWRGIMSYKNTFGAAAVCAGLFFAAALAARSRNTALYVALCAAWLFAFVAARSRSPWMALVIGLAVLVYERRAWLAGRSTQAAMRHVAIGLVAAISVLPFVIGPVAAMFGNADPLNGRTGLWGGAVAILRERPLTGYGYAVVWARGTDTLLPHVPVTAHRSATSAHNGIVNIATELGIPAAALACAFLFAAVSAAARLFDRQPTAFSLVALVLLIALVALEFAEAHALRIHSMLWILFVALAVAVERAAASADPARPTGMGIPT